MKAAIPLMLMLFAGALIGEVHAVTDAQIYSHKAGIWQIAEKGTLSRWIVIHNLDEARGSGIFHIEVIGREKGRQSWEIKRIRPHMAVTLEALKRSVIKPLQTGAVYPESFDDAYATGKKDFDAGKKDVCDTSVLECIKGK